MFFKTINIQYFPDEMEFHFRPKSQENGVQISILSNFHFIENETAKFFRFPFSANVPISFKMQHPGTRKQCWRDSTAHPTFLSSKRTFKTKWTFENVFVFMFCFNHTTQRAVYRLRQTQQDKRRRCSGGECVMDFHFHQNWFWPRQLFHFTEFPFYREWVCKDFGVQISILSNFHFIGKVLYAIVFVLEIL